MYGLALADAPAGLGFPLGAVGQGCGQHRASDRRGAHPALLTGAEPPGQAGCSIQTREEEHKGALHAAAIATSDCSFLPKHEPSSRP